MSVIAYGELFILINVFCRQVLAHPYLRNLILRRTEVIPVGLPVANWALLKNVRSHHLNVWILDKDQKSQPSEPDCEQRAAHLDEILSAIRALSCSLQSLVVSCPSFLEHPDWDVGTFPNLTDLVYLPSIKYSMAVPYSRLFPALRRLYIDIDTYESRDDKDIQQFLENICKECPFLEVLEIGQTSTCTSCLPSRRAFSSRLI